MTAKTVLVCLTSEAATPALLRAAAALARTGETEVIGLHTLAATPIYPGVAVHMTGAASDSFNAAQKETAEAIEALFGAFSDDGDFDAEWRLMQADSTTAADRMVETAMTADLVVMAQEMPEHDRPDQRGVQEAVIRRSGRPVIVIPAGWEGETLGQSMVVGWSATRESARAVHDAAQMAAPEATMHILVAGSGPGTRTGEMDTARELAANLDRKGIAVELIGEEAPDRSVAAALQDAADEHGSDMIVTGAFGHSRIYDFVLGAVTTELLETMRRPVLFSK